MHKYFEEQFNYNHEANQRYIEAILGMDNISSRVLKVFSHILNAHEIWLARIEGHAPIFDIWELHIPTVFPEIEYENKIRTQELLESAIDLEQVVVYKNSQGLFYENTVQDIFSHICYHSAYHRGQAATQMRMRDIEPPNSDYIFYKRGV